MAGVDADHRRPGRVAQRIDTTTLAGRGARLDGHRMSDFLEKNPWGALRQFTNARIALGRAGNSLPTEPLLAFELSHAQARDAVHQPLDAELLHVQLRANGFATLDVHSAAPDREHYLRRPDLGRRLADDSREALAMEQ